DSQPILVDKTKRPADIISEMQQSHKKCVLTAFSAGSMSRIHKLLKENDFIFKDISEFKSLTGLPSETIAMAELPIDHSFETTQQIFLSEQDIFGEKMTRPTRKRRTENFIRELSSLIPGEY